MSFHSLAKELGVSEYFIKNYIKGKKLTRAESRRSCGYVLSDEDKEKIKILYKNRNVESGVFLLYRIYDSFRRHRYILAGVYSIQDKELVQEFVDTQYTTVNDYHKRCYNFSIVSRSLAEKRMKRFLAGYEQGMALEIQKSIHFLTKEQLVSAIENKQLITLEQITNLQVAKFIFSTNSYVFIPLNDDISYEDSWNDENQDLPQDI